MLSPEAGRLHTTGFAGKCKRWEKDGSITTEVGLTTDRLTRHTGFCQAPCPAARFTWPVINWTATNEIRLSPAPTKNGMR